MSGEGHDADVDPADEALRRRLGGAPPTSPAHDRAVLEAAARAGEAIAAARPARLRRWLLPLAAAVMLAVTLPWLIDPAGPPAPVVRGPASAVTPAAGAVLSAPPAAIRGPGIPGARNYVLIVRDAAARELWRSEPRSEPEFPVTGGLLGALPGEGTVLWTLSADTPAGPQERGPYWFRLEP